VTWVLGLGWGVLAALPLVRRARHAALRNRLAGLRTGAPSGRRDRAPAGAFAGALAAVAPLLAGVARWRQTAVAPAARVVAPFVARRRDHARDTALGRELPIVIDLLGVAIAAGCTPYLAVRVAADWGPPRAAAWCREVMRLCALGMSFDQSLEAVASSTPLLQPLADALLASDRLGAPVGPQLTRLAEEERAALRRRADAHARRVPVKLLFPLVFLVLPAFVLLTVVPGLAAGLRRL
jgi:tight adherence protein C